LEWARETFDVEINVSNSVLSVRQPEESRRKINIAMESFNEWEMAGMDKSQAAAGTTSTY